MANSNQPGIACVTWWINPNHLVVATLSQNLSQEGFVRRRHPGHLSEVLELLLLVFASSRKTDQEKKSRQRKDARTHPMGERVLSVREGYKKMGTETTKLSSQIFCLSNILLSADPDLAPQQVFSHHLLPPGHPNKLLVFLDISDSRLQPGNFAKSSPEVAR